MLLHRSRTTSAADGTHEAAVTDGKSDATVETGAASDDSTPDMGHVEKGDGDARALAGGKTNGKTDKADKFAKNAAADAPARDGRSDKPGKRNKNDKAREDVASGNDATHGKGSAGKGSAGKGSAGKDSADKDSADKGSAPKQKTPRRIILAEALGMFLGILLVAVIILCILLAGRGTTDASTGYSSDWTKPSDAASDSDDGLIELGGATFDAADNGLDGTVDFSEGNQFSWSVDANKPVLNLTNTMGKSLTQTSVLYVAKDSTTADQLRAEIKKLGSRISDSIGDDEITQWQISCGGYASMNSGDTTATDTCTLGGLELQSPDDFDLFTVSEVIVDVVDTDQNAIMRYQYDLADDRATKTPHATLGEWDDDLGKMVPQPQGLTYGNLSRSSSDGWQFTIYDVDESAFDDYLAKCEDAGWTFAKESSSASVTYTSQEKDNYTLTLQFSDHYHLATVSLLTPDTSEESSTATSTES